MNSDTMFVIAVLPSLIAGVLFVVFTYLYQQSRAAYFRAWQLGWACYCAASIIFYYNLTGHESGVTLWCYKVLFAMVPLFFFASTRLIATREFPLHWRDVAMLFLFLLWAGQNTYAGLTDAGRHQHSAVFLNLGGVHLPFGIHLGMALLIFICVYRFWMYGRKLHAFSFYLLSVSLAVWGSLLVLLQFPTALAWVESISAGHLLGPLPQTVVGISMVMVLYENERRTVQEGLLAFSSLDLDASRILEAAEIEPALLKMLDRMLHPLLAHQGAIWIADSSRRVLPWVQRGFSAGFLEDLGQSKGGEYLSEMLAGKERISFSTLEAVAGELGDARAHKLAELLKREEIQGLTALNLHTRETSFGVVLVPHVQRSGYGSSQLRLLAAMARQLSMTLENYSLMQDAARRTQEFELLAQIGQVVSSRLDSDEVLRTVHRELSRLFDASTFYIAFMDAEEVRFELEFDDGVLVPKRSRKVVAGITEYIIRTGEPLLLRSDLARSRAKLGLVATGRPSKCFCGVPIFMYGRAVGVMAALSYDREFVFEQRDLDVMRTAAGQVAVAMENARLFAEEQRRSKYLEFLNSISKTAISSQEPEAMMAEIVSEIQKNFKFDHIGIGMLDYATKDIEIKAEAGTTEKASGRRVPLGVGILGRVARSGEMSLIQNTSDGRLLGILPESKSVLCVPITYGETLMGVLNVESRKENAFAPQEVLILRTLADLLATALHNAFVFQKMQQQSITDGLTGIKTRRFFNESLQSEWKRASRSGRPFSVVLIDLDKFKTVNDTLGHLEGDLVLARVGRILEQKSRQSNVVARYGGDEFVMLMPETSVEQALILAERMRLWVAGDNMLNERQITGSFGVATYPVHGGSAEDILRVADMGMYTSKRKGGNQVTGPEGFGFGDTVALPAQKVAGYIESFLQREQLGPESLDDLVGTLARIYTSAGNSGGNELVTEAIAILNHAAESREVTGTGHGKSVAEYAELIGRELMPADELADLIQGARIHDVGKLLIPEAILNKESRLTADERRVLQEHPVLGARIVDALPGGSRISTFIRHHHEHFDGAGYPDKLQGEAIPLGSRIIAVAEAYAHMTLDRPYLARKSQAHTLAELEKLSGTQFDGMVVRVFLAQMRAKTVRSGA